jgi:hypothetical protein
LEAHRRGAGWRRIGAPAPAGAAGGTLRWKVIAVRTLTPPEERPAEAPPAPRPHPRRTALLLALEGLIVLAATLVAVVLVVRDSGVEEPAPPVATQPAPTVTFGEEARANWDVTGIAAGAVLNVHEAPGSTTAVLTTLPSDAAELESTGRIARVDGALWRELLVPGDGTGWVDARYLTETAPPAPPAPQVTYGTEPRANWDVTGVAAGDQLNVRSGPGVTNAVIARLAADTTELESTGRIARVDGALWRELLVPGDGTGWVNARYLTETAPPALPAPVAATAAAIERAATAEDWDGLARLALREPTTFTASYAQGYTTPEALAAYWRDLTTREPIGDIAAALVRLPSWFTVTAEGGDGTTALMYVTPRFHHEATAANRAALEQAIGADRVAAAMVDGQYLGWRVGITADGDWRFFVTGD